MIDRPTAERFAALTLAHLGRPWPFKLDHVMAGPEDVRSPADLHPIFHGSFDWHSCVHGWWQVMRLRRLFPDMAPSGEIAAIADRMLVADKVAGEVATFSRPTAAGASRPYGWAWLLALHGELGCDESNGWAAALEPLARLLADRFRHHLPLLTYPIRVGTHFNTAFALIHVLEWGRTHDSALAALAEARALAFYGADRGCQAWEPGGDEFLSPALIEALLMSRILPRASFAEWFDAFLPDIAAGQPETLFTPATVSDRSDGKIAHLDGLNLSRAWCWRGVAASLGEGHPVAASARAAAQAHLDAALPHLAGDYMGEHWLATYALLAMEDPPRGL